MGFVDAIKTCFNKYAVFKGRASRSEFWYFWLFQILIQLGLGIIQIAILLISEHDPEVVFDIISGLIGLALLVPNLSVAARRLHDIDRTGWWQLLFFIPVLGWIALIVFWCLRGTEGPNRFGEASGAPVV